jgi:hypothetical protein
LPYLPLLASSIISSPRVYTCERGGGGGEG